MQTQPSERNELIITPDDLILVTGANGFIGCSLVQRLLERGFCRLRCFVRPSSNRTRLNAVVEPFRRVARVEMFEGNLLSRDDCAEAAKDVLLAFHLAAARGEKSFPDAFMNSVVTARNLIEALLDERLLRRFVNVSSFSVYANSETRRGRILDEGCAVESCPELRGEAYCFAKVKQEELVASYGKSCGLKWVMVRPGHVYGPGNPGITGRVGISSFGLFLHLGGSNDIPLSYVDNCAEAIALAGLTPHIDYETFNVVDDELVTSRELLRQYKKNVKAFNSLYLPHAVSYVLCYLWEKYSIWSEGQLPLAFNRRRWRAMWKKTHYTNEKVKSRLGWSQTVATNEGLRRYFVGCRERGARA